MGKSNTGEVQNALGYSVRLEFAREHFQALPSVAPGNLVPKTLSTTVSAWADGMHTYCYAIDNKVAVKHVFTSNRHNLQEEANIIFREIQLHVELRREVKGPGIFISQKYHFVNLIICRRLLHTSRRARTWDWLVCDWMGRCSKLSPPRTRSDGASRSDLRGNRGLFRGSTYDHGLGYVRKREGQFTPDHLSVISKT